MEAVPWQAILGMHPAPKCVMVLVWTGRQDSGTRTRVCVCARVRVLCAALVGKARDNYKCVRAQLFSVCSQLLPGHS